MADFDAYDDRDPDDPGGDAWEHLADEAAGAGDPIAAGVEQFQRAALDALGAARAMLDAAETVLKQPGALDQVSGTFAALAKTATETVLGFASGAAGGGGGTKRADVHDVDATSDDAGSPDGWSGDGDDGFQSITID